MEKRGSFLFGVLAVLILLAGCSGTLPAAVPVTGPPAIQTSTPGTSAQPTAQPTATLAPPTVLASSPPPPSPTSVALVPTSLPALTPPASATLPSAGLSPTELKYRLIAQFGNVFFCDPDLYPVAHEVTQSEIDQHVAAIQSSNPEEYRAILEHLGLAGVSNLAPEQRQEVYQESKKLNAIVLTPTGAAYQFNLRVTTNGRSADAISGTITAAGSVTVTQRQPTIATCPICLASGTLIDTPHGLIQVQNLTAGMPIWTQDPAGRRVQAVIMQTVARPVPAGFPIVHLVLADRRELWASPNHPTPDGRLVGELRAGDELDGALVVLAERVPYNGGQTFDVLPSGGTGLYWANGILLKTTLK